VRSRVSLLKYRENNSNGRLAQKGEVTCLGPSGSGFVCFPFCNAPSDEIRQNKMYEKRVGNKHAMQCMATTGQFASICQYLCLRRTFLVCRVQQPLFSCHTVSHNMQLTTKSITGQSVNLTAVQRQPSAKMRIPQEENNGSCTE